MIVGISEDEVKTCLTHSHARLSLLRCFPLLSNIPTNNVGPVSHSWRLNSSMWHQTQERVVVCYSNTGYVNAILEYSYRTSTLCLPLEFVLKTLEEKLSAARGINKYDRDNAKKAKTVIYRLTKKELHLLGLASLKCSRVLKSRGALQ